MPEGTSLQRLAESVTPDDEARLRVKQRILSRTDAVRLRQTVDGVLPDSSMRLSLRRAVVSRLLPIAKAPFIHGSLKWAAAFAVFLLVIRAMPLVFLVPALRADSNVQIIPNGDDVQVLIGGLWQQVTTPQVIRGPLLIRTGASRVTIILNSDGVFRLEPDTTFKLHDIGEDRQSPAVRPTASLVRGQVWILGLVAPLDDAISVETSRGIVSVNSGSASVSDDGTIAVVTIYDRGATFQSTTQTSLLVSGEQGVARSGSPLALVMIPTRAFTAAGVSENLQQDAVHRAEIAKLQQERRERMAGILPTSILYSAKRMAEEVDVLFTLNHDVRAEKRIQQADTRLSEALALLQQGQNAEASVPLTEYRDSLVAMASGTGDNLVKFLIKRQIADASVTLSSPSSSGSRIQLVRSAILDVSAAIPDAALQSRDIEGYVLVDKLTEINYSLSVVHNLTGALAAYADVQPYLKSLLAEKDGTHPLLQKEARSLLVVTSALIKEAGKGNQENKLVAAVQSDISRYLPAETASVLLSEEELNKTVQAIVSRMLIFKSPLSRYNQLIYDMSELKGNPNRGMLLRRLYRALPENGLGGYVLTEIKNLGDELKGR